MLSRILSAAALLTLSAHAGAQTIDLHTVHGQSSVTALSFFFSALLVMRGRRPRGPK